MTRWQDTWTPRGRSPRQLLLARVKLARSALILLAVLLAVAWHAL